MGPVRCTCVNEAVFLVDVFLRVLGLGLMDSLPTARAPICT